MSAERVFRLRLVIASAVAIVVVVSALIVAGWNGWPWAFALALANALGLLAASLHRRDQVLLRVWRFALAFGIAELAVDAWLVHITGTLSYAPYSRRGGPMLWASPAFMPISWQVLAAHLAVISETFAGQPLWRRLAITGLVGGAYVPVCEELAVRGGFWVYHGVPMVSNVPLYIVTGEIGLGIAIVLLMPWVISHQAALGVLAGALTAAALAAGYALGIYLF